jgi:hypothetical protein
MTSNVSGVGIASRSSEKFAQILAAHFDQPRA